MTATMTSIYSHPSFTALFASPVASVSLLGISVLASPSVTAVSDSIIVTVTTTPSMTTLPVTAPSVVTSSPLLPRGNLRIDFEEWCKEAQRNTNPYYQCMRDQEGAEDVNSLGTRDINAATNWYCPLPTNLLKYQDLDSDVVQLFSANGITDLRTNDPNVSDMEYFEFNAQNRADSGVGEWYVAYSASYMQRRANNTVLQDRGEVNQFAFDFAQQPNFNCNAKQGHCLDKEEGYRAYRALYPGHENRPLARRVYFMLYQIDQMAQKFNGDIESLNHLNTWFQELAPNYVRQYTQQVDDKKSALCSFLHQLVDQLITTAVSMGMSGVDRVVGDLINSGGPLDKLIFSAHTRGALEAMGSALNSNGQALLKGMANHKGNIGFGFGINDPKAPFEFNSLNTFYQMLKEYGNSYSKNSVMAEMAAHNIEDMGGEMINGGVAHGIMCNEFEGNWQDLNPQNVLKLKTYLNDLFDETRSLMLFSYEQMYMGALAIPGTTTEDIPVASYFSKMAAEKKWFGDHSIMQLQNKWHLVEQEMKIRLHKELVSGMLSNGQNFMQCTHNDNAPGACAYASSQTSEFERSIFCPKPVDDPRLICMLSRWLTQDHGSHVVSFNGLDTISSDKNFPTPNKVFYDEVFKSYEMFGNNRTFSARLFADTLLSEPNTGETYLGRYHMPVCISDDLLSFENWHRGQSGVGGSGNSYRFPSTCGNFAADETEQFMSQLGVGVGSPLWKFRTITNNTNGLYRDRIMRNLKDIPPVNRYLSLCSQHLHWPRHKERLANNFHVYQNQDADCQLVRDAVAGKTEEQANQAFCKNDMGHSIFDHKRGERDHVEVPEVPIILRVENHEKRCARWLKKPWTTRKLNKY